MENKSHLIEDQNFKGLDFSKEKMIVGRYDTCAFIDCKFANVNLSNVDFVACTFDHCDLSMAIIGHTSFKEVRFIHCKLIGLNFHDVNPFLLSMEFEDCQLNYASFKNLILKSTPFLRCSLLETDFSEANLAEAKFIESNLERTVFDQTNLEKADLQSALNYTIDPERNRLLKAKFSSSGLTGLLAKYGIVVE